MLIGDGRLNEDVKPSQLRCGIEEQVPSLQSCHQIVWQVNNKSGTLAMARTKPFLCSVGERRTVCSIIPAKSYASMDLVRRRISPAGCNQRAT